MLFQKKSSICKYEAKSVKETSNESPSSLSLAAFSMAVFFVEGPRDQGGIDDCPFTQDQVLWQLVAGPDQAHKCDWQH